MKVITDTTLSQCKLEPKNGVFFKCALIQYSDDILADIILTLGCIKSIRTQHVKLKPKMEHLLFKDIIYLGLVQFSFHDIEQSL